MAEGYRRLEAVAGAAEEQLYQKGVEARRVAGLAAGEVGESLEVMDQTDEGERLVKTLVRLIESGRLKVRVYTRGLLHSKAYIFDYEPDGRFERGIAVVGSSNFTLAGISHNTELNVIVSGNDNQAELGEWFEELWDEAEGFDESLMEEMKRSWAIAPSSPCDVYMKTLYTLVRDRLEEFLSSGKRCCFLTATPRNKSAWDIYNQIKLFHRELQVMFAGTEDAAVRERINALERPFGGPLVSAVERRLNQLQRQSVKGDGLLRELEGLYSRCRMYEISSRPEATRGEVDTPCVICSEALT